jgi:hypothetical protein
VKGATELPTECRLWRSKYAQMLILQTEDDEVTKIKRIVQTGQEWLDLSCMDEEQGGSVAIDGYLLLLLSRKPSAPLDSVIRSIELDPVACRKHVAWPECGDSAEVRWLRIFRVTALGLPSSLDSTGMTGSPLLESHMQQRILDDIRQYRGGRQAARQHAENPSSAPHE